MLLGNASRASLAEAQKRDFDAIVMLPRNIEAKVVIESSLAGVCSYRTTVPFILGWCCIPGSAAPSEQQVILIWAFRYNNINRLWRSWNEGYWSEWKPTEERQY